VGSLINARQCDESDVGSPDIDSDSRVKFIMIAYRNRRIEGAALGLALTALGSLNRAELQFLACSVKQCCQRQNSW